MSRATSAVVLLGGAALLVTWIVSPASSSPKRDLRPTFAQISPALSDINQQVDKLSARLAARAAYAEPTRDPFAFGGRAAPTGPTAAAAVAVAAAPPPAVQLPHLVAILTSAASASAGRTAVLSVGDGVQFAKAGERVVGLLLKSVDADGVVLVDDASGASFDVALH